MTNTRPISDVQVVFCDCNRGTHLARIRPMRWIGESTETLLAITYICSHRAFLIVSMCEFVTSMAPVLKDPFGAG